MEKVKKPIKGWVRVLLIIIPFLIFVGVFTMIAGMLLGLKRTGNQEALTTFQSLVLELFMLAGTFAVVAIFRRWIDRESFKSLGFGMKNFRRELETGFWLGLFMIAAGFLLLVLLHEINWTGINPDALSIFLSCILFIAVGFTEELFFRGYILNNLMLSMNRWVALLVSSVVFSLAHIGNAHFSVVGFTTIIMAGLLLGLPYIFTKSLWLPIALHFSWNFFQGTIFGFSVSGNTEYALVTQSRTTDTLLNGGPFGFEGSILAVIFLSLAIVALAIRYDRKEKRLPVATQPLIQVIEEQPETPSAS
jgi:membrane protease YdiL (CAAX protease family)